jgi:hypothetical protein
MPRTFTLGQLVTRVLDRFDDSAGSFATRSLVKGYLSTAFGELHGLVVSSGLRYFEAPQALTTTGGASFALPADHLGTVGVDYLDPSGWRRALTELMPQERNIYTQYGTWSGLGWARAYSVIGQQLTLYPTPPSGQSYEHIYVPQPLDLSDAADATSVDVVTPDGEDFLIWTSLVMAQAKEESDTSVAERKSAQARNRVIEWAQLRALHTVRRQIVDEGLGWNQDLDPGDWRYGRRGW